MQEWATVIGCTLMAGIAMPVGATLAGVDRILPRWGKDELHHGVIAFGAGALLSAVALVLVPEGSADRTIPAVAFWFASGGVAFMAFDILLNRLKSSASQLVAMLTDFLPEAVAMGASFAAGSESAMLLAGIMTLQNLPEGFNAYRELVPSAGIRGTHVIMGFAAMALLGPAAGLAGYFWLSAYPLAVSAMMLFAAGGILYIIFQDIAVQVPLKRHWAPPLWALAGFLLGLMGQMLATG